MAQRSSVRWWAGAALLVGGMAFVARSLDTAALAATWSAARVRPAGMGLALVAYAAAFGLRALLWVRVLPRLGLGHALAALHVSLAGNHVLPLRLGEALRVTSVARRTSIGLAEAAASTVTLRAADVLAVVTLAALLGPRLVADLAGGWAWLVPPAVVAVGAVGVAWLRRLARRRRAQVRLPGAAVLAGAAAAWVLESGVVWQSARWAGLDVTALDAVLVTAVTIAAQVVAVAPGGLGTYEAAATAAFVALGAAPGPALAAALTAHAVKTGYALLTGAVAVAVPAPSLLGRVRLVRRAEPSQPAAGSAEDAPGAASAEDASGGAASAGDASGAASAGDASGGAASGDDAPGGVAPVVLFLPAHDEQDSVGDVVRRVPATVAGRPVRCVVIDDGSADRTAEVAGAAGAEVVRVAPNRGLGAAVRRGLAEGLARGAAAVAFCDADGEYAPEELERLVAPVLEGRADYVVGSRFSGEIRRMLPHRRLGNRALTVALRFVARLPISDGQSGYRALSPAAAADAEVIHDFNYAQVLTLDLLAKGFRYAEVPISYGFRETGRSFVRLHRYLRAVVPAVHRELNTPAAAAEGGVQSSTT